MATSVTSISGAVFATVIGSLSTACSDVVVDSIVVERSRGAPQVCTSPVQNFEILWQVTNGKGHTFVFDSEHKCFDGKSIG